jgi:hypothetical protein
VVQLLEAGGVDHLAPVGGARSRRVLHGLLPGDHSKKIRHERLVRALKLVGVETVLGHFSHEDAKCRDCGSTWQKPTEKATDINLALSVYDDAVQDVMDTAYLLTADTDQAATAKLFAKRFPGKKLVSVSPPGPDPLAAHPVAHPAQDRA